MGEDLNTRVSNPFHGAINIGALRGETIPQHRLFRMHPQFINVNSPRSEKGANSSFNALHTKLSRRFTGGLTLITSYQWSKALDNASEDQGCSYMTVSEMSSTRVPSGASVDMIFPMIS